MIPLQTPVELFGLPIHPVEATLVVLFPFEVALTLVVAALSILLAADLPKGLEGVAVGMRWDCHDSGGEDDQGGQGFYGLIQIGFRWP